MGLREKLEVVVDANVSGFVRGMDKAGAAADKGLGKTDERLAMMAGRLTSFGAAAMGAGAVAAVGLGKLASMAAEAQTQQLKLTNSVQNSSNTFKSNGQALRDQASALQKVTAAEDDATVGMQAILVQFGLTESQVMSLTPLVVDLSRKMGVDMDAAAKAVGKSATGTGTALKRMGIDVAALGEGSTDAEKTISALSKSVGGFATSEGKTFSGQIAIIKNQLAELGEGVGGGVIDVVKPITEAGVKLNDISPAAANAAGKILTIGTAGVTAAGGLAFVAGQAMKMRDVLAPAAADGTRQLNAMGKAAAGVAIATAAISVGFVLDALGKSDASQFFDRTTAASKGSTDEILANLSAAGNATKGFVDNFTAGFSDSLLKFSDGTGASLANIDRALGDAYKANDFDNVTKGIEALRSAAANPINAPIRKDILAVINDYEGKLKDSAEANKAAGGAASDAGDEIAGAGDQVEEAASKYTDYANAIQAATNPLFAVTDASQKLAEAEKALAEARTAFDDGATPEEVKAYADAQRDAAKAALDEEAAIATLRGAFEDGSVEYADAIALIDRLKAQYPELGAELDALGADFDAAAGKAAALESPPPIAITATTTEFDSSIAAVEGQQINEKDVFISAVLDPFKKGVSEVEKTKPSTVKAPIDGDTKPFAGAIGRVAATRPPTVFVPVEPQVGNFQAKMNALLAPFRGQVLNIPVNPFRAGADGFVSYAAGGTRLPQNAMIQPGRGGGLVQWAEGETGGEAFIPLAPSKRKRSKDLWWETGQRLGVVSAADGGITSFAFGGFSADDYMGQLIEQMNNFWQGQFDTATVARQIEMATQRRDALEPWSDEWKRWNDLAIQKTQDLGRAQLEAAEEYAAAQRDLATNQFEWMYDHMTTADKLATAMTKRDSLGQFTDEWIRWAKEVESLQDTLEGGMVNGKTSRSGGTSGGAINLNITVNAEGLITSPVAVGSQIVEAIRAYERSAGPGWRN